MNKNVNPYETDDNSQLITFFSQKNKILWCYLNPISTPTLTMGLLRSIRDLQDRIAKNYFEANGFSPNYIVWDSVFNSIFSLGIDLEYILPLIKSANQTKLSEYLDLCADVLYLNYVNLELPIITISYLRNRAYGAGFDALMSSDIIIAKKNARCGYPALKKGLLDCAALGLIQRRFNNNPLMHKICKGEMIVYEDMRNDQSFKFLGENETLLSIINTYTSNHNQFNMGRVSESLIMSLNKNSQGLTRDSMLSYKRLWIKSLLDIPYERYEELYKVIMIQKYLHKKCFCPDFEITLLVN